ncbi:MAG: hypothetical protein ACI3XZ_02690, partial [Butyricicoccus sp.]
HCKTEYRDGFTVCADCGAQLVDNLPETPEDSAPSGDAARPAEPVLLMHCPTTFDADATLALLRSFDIPCFSHPDMDALKTYTGVSMTGENIFVERSQAAQAREIVRGFRKGRGQIDTDDAEALLAQTAAQEPVDPDPITEFLSQRLPRIALLIMFAASVLIFLLTRFL